ncbi:MAG: hypothetical protein AABY18_02265, partial [Candidatus Thermoplasmatota archaeon]
MHAETSDEVVIVDFASPAVAEGNMTVHATWAILEFRDSPQATLSIDTSSQATFNYVNKTWVTNYHDAIGGAEMPLPDGTGVRKGQLLPFSATWNSLGFVGIRADDITIDVASQTGEFSPWTRGPLPNSGKGLDDAVSVWAAEPDGPQVTGEITNAHAVRLQIRGISGMEFLGAQVSCSASFCPTGGHISHDTVATTTIERFNFERITDVSGQGELSANPLRLRFGGPSLGLDLAGAMRFPKAEISGDCDCQLDENATLSLAGFFQLATLTPNGNGRMTSSVRGEAVQAYADESSLAIPALERKRIVTATAVGLATVFVLAKLLLPLFTRLSKQEALEHPKRQK